MDESVYSTEKISTGLALSFETGSTPGRQYTVLIRYLGAFESLQDIANVPLVPLLNQFAVGTVPEEAIIRLAYSPEVLYRSDTTDGVRAGSTGRKSDRGMLSDV